MPNANGLAAAEDSARKESPTAPGSVSECPLRFAVEVVALDEAGAPVRDVALELRRGGEAMRTRTGDDGGARFDGLEHGTYAVSLYQQPDETWSVTATTALPASKKQSDGAASWQPAPAATAGGSKHKVEQGETVSKLAHRFGIDADALWKANGELAQKRKSREILLPGDVIELPARTVKSVNVASGQLCTVKLVVAGTRFRVRFLADDGSPREKVAYHLSVESDSGTPIDDIVGETKDDGFVDQPIPWDASVVTVLFGQGDDQEEYRFRVGHLDPADAPSGLRARLRNLGYDCPEEDGVGPRTKAVLRLFQANEGLPETGEADDATRARLVEKHLS